MSARTGGDARPALAPVFVGLGLTASLPAAAVGLVGASLRIPIETASLTVSFVFAGLAAGVVLTALVGSRRGLLGLVSLGAAVQAVGSVVVAGSVGTVSLLAGATLLGLGFGATELTAVAAARLLGGATARRLTRLTALLALTAATAPVAVAVLGPAWSWRAAFAVAAVVQVVAAVTVLSGSTALSSTRTAARWRTALRPRRWHLVALAYVGAETLVVAWVTQVAGTALGLPAAPAVLAVAASWLSLALGRAGASRLLGRGVVPAALLVRALLGATVLLVLAAVLPGAARVLALVAALMCAGPVYSLVLAQAESYDTRGLAVLVGSGALGGAAVSALGAPVHAVAGIAGVLLLAAAALGFATLVMPSSHRGRFT